MGAIQVLRNADGVGRGGQKKRYEGGGGVDGWMGV